ncbi:Chymotrypsin inhibitor [Lucilia cuprina]|nr:Chymotrypsin inhibitor [Lucilia cuprina]
MSKLFQSIFYVFVIVLAFVAATEGEECLGANIEFNYCGTLCPPKCAESDKKPCSAECIPGCNCKKGFVLNSSNECVLPEEC